MSGYDLSGVYGCVSWRDMVLGRLPWLNDIMQCAGCGRTVVLVRQLGTGVMDEVWCQECASRIKEREDRMLVVEAPAASEW